MGSGQAPTQVQGLGFKALGLGLKLLGYKRGTIHQKWECKRRSKTINYWEY